MSMLSRMRSSFSMTSDLRMSTTVVRKAKTKTRPKKSAANEAPRLVA